MLSLITYVSASLVIVEAAMLDKCSQELVMSSGSLGFPQVSMSARDPSHKAVRDGRQLLTNTASVL